MMKEVSNFILFNKEESGEQTSGITVSPDSSAVEETLETDSSLTSVNTSSSESQVCYNSRYRYTYTRSSGPYGPFLLAPAEGFGAFGPYMVLLC